MNHPAAPGRLFVHAGHLRLSILRTMLLAVLAVFSIVPAGAAQLKAGVAKVVITDATQPSNDPLYVKALVLDDGTTRAVIITLDAVAIAEIGTIKHDYLARVRAELQKEVGIQPANVFINASHCHGRVCADVEQRTVQAVRAAAQQLVPVRVGAGTGHEDRIMENRRLILKNGREADVRHAYSLPPDEEVARVGPVDPQIGILRLDQENGKTLAVVYNFACHPILGVPNGGNAVTADLVGFASKVIEDNLSEGTIALFIQGCAGDINPVQYKDVANPRDAETLGNLLGLSTLQALKKIPTRGNGALRVINETLELPRARLTPRIESMQVEQAKLVQGLTGTSLNFKTFLPLVVKYNFSPEFPSYYSHRYLHEKMRGKNDLKLLDAENRTNLEAYLKNIHTMEELTRHQTNLKLLQMHHAQNEAAGNKAIQVEVLGIRIGDFVLGSFPGELTVQIGLNIKKASPHKLTFVAGYSNGYIYYAPTAEQLRNVGGAQEDSDCILAPEWQKLYEARILEILKRL